jgi:hypothetical protein
VASPLVFCTAAVLASVFHVFVKDEEGPLRLFLFGLLNIAAVLFISLRLPYRSVSFNGGAAFGALASLILSVCLLGLQDGGATSGYFPALIVLGTAALLVCALRTKLSRCLPSVVAPTAAVLPASESKLQSAPTGSSAVSAVGAKTAASSTNDALASPSAAVAASPVTVSPLPAVELVRVHVNPSSPEADEAVALPTASAVPIPPDSPSGATADSAASSSLPAPRAE